MTQKTINCAECNKEFNYVPNPHYRDNRKYCDPCGLARKVAWETQQEEVKPEVEKYPPKAFPKGVYEKPKDNGFHLTPENIRASALKCAVKSLTDEGASEETFWRLVKRFEQYILTGE